MGKLSRVFNLIFFVLSMAATASGCSVLHQQIIAAARHPGEQVATPPDQVWREFDCGRRERPFVHIETMEVLPEMIKPGGRANYRLIYVMCSDKPSDVLRARVVRNMRFKGESVAHNVKDSLTLKPGRWVVDSFFTLPPETPTGVYALEVGVEASNGYTQKKVRSFVVSNEFYLTGP
jgi:hypothetical protein